MKKHAIAVAFVALAFLSAPLAASDRYDPRIDRLAESLHLGEVFEVMAAEALASDADLRTGLLAGRGGAAWDETMHEIYDPAQLLSDFKQIVAADLSASNGDIDAMIVFFDSDLGQEVVGLEVAARRALLDPSVDEASRQQLEKLWVDDATRLEEIERFVAAGDLVESNVAGALNASYAFLSGLAATNAAEGSVDESEILSMVWSQESEIREEIETWLYSYLAMAYAPLSDDDLQTYVEFSESEVGHALNRAMFAGFDAILSKASRNLGLAAGRILSGQEL